MGELGGGKSGFLGEAGGGPHPPTPDQRPDQTRPEPTSSDLLWSVLALAKPRLAYLPLFPLRISPYRVLSNLGRSCLFSLALPHWPGLLLALPGAGLAWPLAGLGQIQSASFTLVRSGLARSGPGRPDPFKRPAVRPSRLSRSGLHCSALISCTLVH